MLSIAGETVSVSALEKGARDALGNEAESWAEPIDVDGVVVGRRSTTSPTSPEQPDAIEDRLAFCFPTGFDLDLRGAKIKRRGRTYRVIGEPAEYTEANLPPIVGLNIRAEAVRVDG